MKLIQTFLMMTIMTLLTVTPALAYVGPGAGLSAIGSFLALAAAVVAAIFGFLWFPIKRMMKGRKQATQNNEDSQQ